MTLAARPRRSLGQNFLVDRRAVSRIVAALEPGPDETVIEIGPGRGALTAALLERAGRLVAIELDRALAEGLRRRFPPERLVVVERDVLAVGLAAVAAAEAPAPPARPAVVGNLPYNISKPIAMKLIAERFGIDRAVLMFQREVAERLTAGPGSKAYGPLSVLTSLTFAVERLFDLPPSAFRPRPKVHSTVTRWRPLAPSDALDARREAALRACLAAAFRRRRRTLRNNLRQALGSEERATALLDRAGVDGGLRAEALPPEAFVKLCDGWPCDV